MLKLFTDTDCDVSPKLAKKLGFNLINMPYFIDNVEYEPYKNFDCHDFYVSLRNGIVPKTASLNSHQYIKIFEKVLSKGDDILYVHFSSKMSGTFNNAEIAIETLKEKYPARKIDLVDTKAISIGALNILYEVSNLYKEGKTSEEIINFVVENRDNFATYFFAEDLEFFKRSGRVNGISAFIGCLLNLKPIMCMTQTGELKVIDKLIGRKNAIKYLINKIDEIGDEIFKHKILIANADTPSAEYIEQYLNNKYGDKIDVEVVDLNPTIGSHCGPGACGICFHAKHR